jgi:hypothetical protein
LLLVVTLITIINVVRDPVMCQILRFLRKKKMITFTLISILSHVRDENCEAPACAEGSIGIYLELLLLILIILREKYSSSKQKIHLG